MAVEKTQPDETLRLARTTDREPSDLDDAIRLKLLVAQVKGKPKREELIAAIAMAEKKRHEVHPLDPRMIAVERESKSGAPPRTGN